ncbi:unnamed protein product [Diamesa serratosioi]
MTSKVILSICVVTLFKTCSIFGDKSVDEEFQRLQIVPDVVPKSPESQLDVLFDCGSIDLGNTFTALQVRNRPTVSWKNAKPNELYTLVMTDPGAIKGRNPNDKEWHHWIVGNIPGNDVDKGDILTSFLPSGPPKDSGSHRYVFLLYKQSGKLDFKNQIKLGAYQMDGRSPFSTLDFAKKHNLGEAVAGNFYLTSWDESVEELTKLINESQLKAPPMEQFY